MMSLSSTQVENRALGSGCDPRTGRTGLLDSGASHPYREATDHELEEADRVTVQLADGKEIVLGQNSSGTPYPEVRWELRRSHRSPWGSGARPRFRGQDAEV